MIRRRVWRQSASVSGREGAFCVKGVLEACGLMLFWFWSRVDAACPAVSALAIAVLAVKVKPPSAFASRTLTAPLVDGVWPASPFGERSRPPGRIAHQRD
jgi:hypothetical protein